MINSKFQTDFFSLGFLKFLVYDSQTPNKINYAQLLEIEPSFENFHHSVSIELKPILPEVNKIEIIPDVINENSVSDTDLASNSLASETIAIIYERQGAFAEAIEIYKRLIEIEPAKTDLYLKKIDDLKNSFNP